MSKTFWIGLLALLALQLPLGGWAQTPVEVDSATLQALRRFDDRQDWAAADAFFSTLRRQEFTEEDMDFTAATPHDTLHARVWYWAAEYFYAAAGYQEAERYALQALPLLRKGHDETTLADCLNILAINHVRQGNYPDAIDYARQVYELDVRSADEERISMSLNTLAGLYISARQPQEAEKYVVKGLEVARRSGLKYRLAIVEGMAAEVYHALRRDSLAAEYAEAAYQKEVHLQRPHKAMIRLSQKAAALIGMQRYAEAETALTTAIGYFRQQGGQQQSLAISLNQRGKARMALAHATEGTDSLLDAAKADFREAAAMMAEMGEKYGEMHARKGLYECLYKTQPDSAREEKDRFLALRDSLYDMASAESLARYNAEFGNDFLQEEVDAERSARRRIVTGIAAGLVVLCLAGALHVRRLKRYRRKQEQLMREMMAQIESSRELLAAEASASEAAPSQHASAEVAARQAPSQSDEGQYSQPAETSPQTPRHDKPQEPSAANEEFLTNTNMVIRQLMPEGHVDTASVASALCMSPSQFRRRISSATGLTAANYILMIRMDEAKQLLGQYPKYPMSEIAERCGFADNAHFTHAFKRLFGTTPSEYITG